MNNKINSLEIKKYIIAKFGVDPTPIFEDKYLSKPLELSSARRARMFLEEKRAEYEKKKSEPQNDPSIALPSFEQYIVDIIKEIHERSRGKRFATYLLRVAKAIKFIGPDTYRSVRESWGITEYDDELEGRLTQKEEKPDPWKELGV